VTGIMAHLRDGHGWTWEQSWEYGPLTLEHLHKREHDERAELEHAHAKAGGERP
jgi:hypothetical protein